jgi:hypothetical protein
MASHSLQVDKAFVGLIDDQRGIDFVRDSREALASITVHPFVESPRVSYKQRKQIRALLLPIFLLLIVSGTVHAQGWRGIVPLHSSRTNVEELIGKSKADETVPTYEFETETVKIFYSKYPCGNPLNLDQWNVPPDTVLHIGITPKRPMELAERHVDLSKFSKKRVSWDTLEYYFFDYENGLVLELNSTGKTDPII